MPLLHALKPATASVTPPRAEPPPRSRARRLPSRPRGEGASEAEEHVPWLHISLVGFAQFAGWMGFVSIEGSLSLMMTEIYGLSHRSVWVVWVPISGLMLVGTLAFSSFHRSKWRAPHVGLVAGAALLVASATLWFGISMRIDEAEFAEVVEVDGLSSNGVIDIGEIDASLVNLVAGIGLLLFAFALTNTLFNSILMQQLLPHQQARFQTPVQTLAAIGRGMGPYLGTLIMTYGNRQPLFELLGPRLLVSFSYGAITLSVLVPSLFGARFYEPQRPPTMW